MAMQMVQGVYNGIKGVGRSVRNVVNKRMMVQGLYESDRKKGIGNRYESTSDVMKRHGIK